MEPRKTERRQDERKATYILLASLGGLVVLTVVAIAIASLKPYSNSHVGSKSVAEKSAPSPEPVEPELQPVTPKPPLDPTSSPAPAATRQKPTSSPPVMPVAATLPEQMARTLPGSKQMLIAIGSRLGSNTGTLEIYNLDDGHWVKVMSMPANFGKTGLTDGLTRKSGHLNTPTGIWFLGNFVFGQHPSPPPGTRMPYRHITQNSWWSDENNATYNTWVESKSHVSGEHLADSTVQYEYAFDTGYNAPPNQRVIGRGAAIFLHIFEPPGNALGKFTHGCVAISRNDMLRVLATLDPARKPSFAIGTRQRGTPTSIYSY